MAKLNKVVPINNGQSNLNVMSTIHRFLTKKGQKSGNTKNTYERAIRDFFRTMRSKELEELVEQDLIFTPQQIEDYQILLKEHYKGATVNNQMTAMHVIYKKFEDDGFNVKASWFNLERYDNHDSVKYGTLSHEEVVQIIDLVSKTRKGSEKALLIRFAYATAFRKDSIITMKWNQIINKEGQWCVKVLGKGNKWSYKKLSDDLYKALMDFKEEKKANDTDKVFQLTEKTIQKMMNYIRENMNFGDRAITFHSFKKASLNEINILSGGDLKAIQAHGDHNDVQTAMNYYIEDKKFEDLMIIDVNYEIPLDKLDDLSKEELLNLIRSADRNTQIKLLKTAKLI